MENLNVRVFLLEYGSVKREETVLYSNADFDKNTIHLTLKMTAQVVETSVTNNSSSQNYTHPDDHTIRTTDTPGFKPLTMIVNIIVKAKT